MLIVEVFGQVKLVYDKLKEKFEMVDLGTVSHFLGMVVLMDMNGHRICATQEGYIGWVLEKFGMSDCKPVGTQMEKNQLDVKGEGDEPCDCTLYLKLIGSLG